jgi:hypothetical protein
MVTYARSKKEMQENNLSTLQAYDFPLEIRINSHISYSY